MSKLYDTTSQRWLKVLEIDYFHKRVLLEDGKSHVDLPFSLVLVKLRSKERKHGTRPIHL